MESGADHSQYDALRIVEKYETFVNYIYPILQNCPRRHGVFRDAVIEELFKPIGMLYTAARSRQVSRLHAIDAVLATLRSFLRFAVQAKFKIISPEQHATALVLLSEVGRMLGSWIKKLSGQAGKQ